MKKHGFTLAEVLVTLGIIGVVAALTTPALIQNVGNAKVGPKLQKAVATFETASETMLTDRNSNSLLGISSTARGIGDNLREYMKIDTFDRIGLGGDPISYSAYSGTSGAYSSHSFDSAYTSNEGMVYYIDLDDERESVHEDYDNTPNNQKIGRVFVDINGIDGPNTVGKDLFVFALYNDGTLRPWGAPGFLRSSPKGDVHILWSSSGGDNQCDESAVAGNGEGCTGSIFDNGMKIKYQ